MRTSCSVSALWHHRWQASCLGGRQAGRPQLDEPRTASAGDSTSQSRPTLAAAPLSC